MREAGRASGIVNVLFANKEDRTTPSSLLAPPCGTFHPPCSSVWLHTAIQRYTLVYATSVFNVVHHNLNEGGTAK